MPKGDYKFIKFRCEKCHEIYTVVRGFYKEDMKSQNICLDCRGGKGIYGKSPTKAEIFAARAKARKKSQL